jgi:hypothetical protein
MTTGGTGSITPVLTGDKLIHEVTTLEAGTNEVLLPEISGKTFFLRLEGRPLKPSEYEILNAGGFRILIPDYTLLEGQRFDLEIYELQTTSGGPAALSSSFITGTVEVASNTTLNGVNHANKLIQLRGGSAKTTLTLPDIATTPENAVFIIEASINNDWQTKVQTQGGQFIYMNNTSWTSLYVGKGESLWLFRFSDGWYVINDFGNYYKNIGKPYAAYTYEDDENELFCNGSNLLKADYPRLWAKIQTLGGSLTPDATVWSNNKGLWLEVDVDTFRIPDLREMVLKGVLSETGTDPNRSLNEPGGFQANQMGQYTDTQGDHGTTNTLDTYTNGAFHFKTTVVNSGKKVLVDNIGVMWVIKY